MLNIKVKKFGHEQITYIRKMKMVESILINLFYKINKLIAYILLKSSLSYLINNLITKNKIFNQLINN